MLKRLLTLILLGSLFSAAAHAEGGMFGTGAAAGAKAHGALAYHAETRNWAYAVKSADPVNAMATAARLCGPGCKVFGPFEGCGVVVANGSAVGYGEGPDAPAAEKAAQGRCGSGGCTVAVWGCNQMAAGEGFGFRQESHYPKNFGAITYDASSGAFGTVWDYPSFAAAVAAAKNNCGKNCRIYAAQGGDCGALAGSSGNLATGAGNDAREAEAMALAKCGGGACRTLTWFCNSKGR